MTVDSKYARQSGGHGQYGHVKLNSSLWIQTVKTYEFVNTIVGGAIPKEYIPAVDEGIRALCRGGILAGYR